jgi:hypothetical protein
MWRRRGTQKKAEKDEKGFLEKVVLSVMVIIK